MPAKDPVYASQLLDQSYRDDAYTPPTDYYILLCTDVPDGDNNGTEVDTAIWTNYARIQVPNDPTNWGPAAIAGTPSTASTWNLIDIDFGAAVIVGTPPVIQGVEVWDDPTAGNRIHYGPIVANVQVINGVTPKFIAGALIIQET